MKGILVPNFEKRGGLIVAIIQGYTTRQLLIQAFMDQEAWEKTLQTKQVHFWSTSKRGLWLKGETSGNYLSVKKIWLDCDLDAALIQVEVTGDSLACHLKKVSCFHNPVGLSGDSLC